MKGARAQARLYGIGDRDRQTLQAATSLGSPTPRSPLDAPTFAKTTKIKTRPLLAALIGMTGGNATNH